MTDRNDNITTTDDLRDRDVVYAAPVASQAAATPPVAAQPVVTHTDSDYRQVTTDVDRPSRVPSFLAGFVTAIVIAAIAFVAFLAISDSDDDGNVDVDVPAVEVDTDTGG